MAVTLLRRFMLTYSPMTAKRGIQARAWTARAIRLHSWNDRQYVGSWGVFTERERLSLAAPCAVDDARLTPVQRVSCGHSLPPSSPE